MSKALRLGSVLVLAVSALAGAGTPSSAGAVAFITTWDTRNTSTGSSAANQIHLPLTSKGTYDFYVDWGDNKSIDHITQWNDPAVTHSYATNATYTVTITGTIAGWRFDNGGDKLKLLNVARWGNLQLGPDGHHFKGATNMNSTATDTPGLADIKDLSQTFYGASNFNGDISGWDVSGIKDMSYMFYLASAFNQPIGKWQTGQVTDMTGMFAYAYAFDQPIGNWDTTNVTNMSEMFLHALMFNQPLGAWSTAHVTNMSGMFSQAYTFNQPLGAWNTANVTDMSGTFSDARSFNQNIGAWNTANVTNMTAMFAYARSFNQNIGGWNTANVTEMNSMFNNALVFNQPIGAWNTANVTDMSSMFYVAAAFNKPIDGWTTGKVKYMNSMFNSAGAFNQPIADWNTGNVTTMAAMFNQAEAFNQPIGSWNTANVTTMSEMFWDAKNFNQPIGDWNTANVTDMSRMFWDARAFNQPIGNWNTTNVTTMSDMFANAQAFNRPIGGWKTTNVTDMSTMFWKAATFDRDIGGWDVRKVTRMDGMFDNAELSTANYDSLLIGWAGQAPVQQSVVFSGGQSVYSTAAQASRQKLIADYNWTVTDFGESHVDFFPTPVAFEAQLIGTSSAPVTITVTNSTAGYLKFGPNAVTVDGKDPNQFEITSDACSDTTIDAGLTCTTQVRFVPTSAGRKTAKVVFADDSWGSPQAVTMTGEASTPDPSPTPPGPADQTVQLKITKIKKKKSVALPTATQQGSTLTWKSTTRRICTVKKYKVKGLRKGACVLKAAAPAVAGFTPYSKTVRIKVR